MAELRYKSVNVDPDTYEKLALAAERTYRTIPAMIRMLADKYAAFLPADNGGAEPALAGEVPGPEACRE